MEEREAVGELERDVACRAGETVAVEFKGFRFDDAVAVSKVDARRPLRERAEVKPFDFVAVCRNPTESEPAGRARNETAKRVFTGVCVEETTRFDGGILGVDKA